jgi:AhpD family alkylhydroperoxidase
LAEENRRRQNRLVAWGMKLAGGDPPGFVDLFEDMSGRGYIGGAIGERHFLVVRTRSRADNGAPKVKARERIVLAVAQVDGCDYCLSAHSYLGWNLAKISPEEVDRWARTPVLIGRG